MTLPVAGRRVAVLAPMRQELGPLLRPLSLREAETAGLLTGSAGALEIVATITGIGMQAATLAAERVLDAGRVDHLVVVGIAGGIGASVAIGDLVLPEVVRDLATGVEHRPVALDPTPPRGTLVTSDRLVVDPTEVAGLARSGVIAIDMETSAVAAVCEARGCPWSVFRAISDRAGDAAIDLDVLGLAGKDGTPDLPALARMLWKRPGRIRELARLGRGMRLATRAAAAAAVRALERMPAS